MTMRKKIVVSERDNIATLFEDDRAVEFIIHRGDVLLGDVYLCTVENILPSIDAAFVHVGGDKMGFLHSSDVQGKGDLRHRLEPKQQLVVQVMKEPTGHKGPRVTTNISLPGRFLVLMPGSKGISISRKIEQQSERSRLKSLVSLFKPQGVGVIIRTEADQQDDADIQEDLETLLERWRNIVAIADSAMPPTLLYRDQDLLYRVIREVVTEDVQELVIDTAFGMQRAQQLLQNWNMDKNIKVSQYTGNQPILVGTGVDREIKQALQTKVPLPSGGYLYIQPTEALTVVDVNSGKFTSLQSQAETIRLTNLEASKEIARQLRLRNIGGMIIVDFIDMESRADKLSILETFENDLAPDKAKPQVGQLSDLGLVELTRHRQGQALAEIFGKKCQQCSGTGHAAEEFNWSPLLDKDSRSSAYARNQQAGGGRGQQQQQGNRGGGGQQQQQRVGSQPGGLQQPGGRPQQQQAPQLTPSAVQQAKTQALNKFLEAFSLTAYDPEKKLLQQLGTGLFLESRKPKVQSSAAPATSAASSAGGQQRNPNQSGNNKDGGNGGGGKPDERWLAPFLQEKLVQKLGNSLAGFVKVAITPIGVNSTLIRLNPKSNDIFTLVHSIELAATNPVVLPILGDTEGDTDSDDEEADDDDDDNKEEMVAETITAEDMPTMAASSSSEEDEDEDEEEASLLEETTPSRRRSGRSTSATTAGSKPRRGRPPKRLSLEEDETAEEETTLLSDEGDEGDEIEADEPRRVPLKRRGRPPKGTEVDMASSNENDEGTLSGRLGLLDVIEDDDDEE